MASYTVNFEDGSSHVYDNVPDNIDQQNVQDRASMEFSDKRVTGVTAGVAETTPQHEPGIGTKLAGAAQTAFEYGKAPIEFAMQHPIATGVGVSLLPEAITNKIPIVNQAAQYGRGALQRLSGITPVSSAARETFNRVAGAEAAPSMIQRGMDMASKMRNIAAPVVQRAAPFLQGAGQLMNAATPAMAFAAPYTMAAQEQAKIRQNPNAPEYANNPYAMVQRGQAPTQGAAGAMNQRTAVMNQQYGGLSQEDQDRLTQDRLNMAIRLKAAKKVLGPVAPTGQ
jgi:hypothetical protein